MTQPVRNPSGASPVVPGRSFNRLLRGVFSRSACLPNEDLREWDRLAESFIAHFDPKDEVEAGVVVWPQSKVPAAIFSSSPIASSYWSRMRLGTSGQPVRVLATSHAEMMRHSFVR